MPQWMDFASNDWITVVIVGVMAAFFVGYIMQGRGYGWLGNLVLGVLGALIGPAIYGLVMRVAPAQYDYLSRLPSIHLGDVAKAMIGAFILLLVVSLIQKRQSKSKSK